MTIFFALNAAGLVFLLYVLAKFWQEERLSRKNSGKCSLRFGRKNWAVVVLPARSHCPDSKGSFSVIPFPAQNRGASDQPASHRNAERPASRISTR